MHVVIDVPSTASRANEDWMSEQGLKSHSTLTSETSLSLAKKYLI